VKKSRPGDGVDLVMRPQRFPVSQGRGSVLPRPGAGLDCLRCQGTLDWSQPDLKAPDRLLGVCAACAAWHLVHLAGDDGEAILVLLPDTLQLCDAGK
jgi:hypothetical protein